MPRTQKLIAKKAEIQKKVIDFYIKKAEDIPGETQTIPSKS